MHYTGQVYRHPIEADTPLLEVTAGCSHNQCAFCTMYRETKFKISPLAHIEEDLQELQLSGRMIKRLFLVNGEPFILATEKLIEIGKLIEKYLPQIEIITCYASIKSLRTKSVEELKQLKALKFDELHIGLESAYAPAIAQMNKGFTVEEAYENIEKLTKAGMTWDAIVMTGVAGRGNGEVHITETAKLINQFPPYMVSVMTTSVSTGTPLEQMRDEGEFIECTELEKIEEEKLLISLLDFPDSERDVFFFGGHNYNLIPFNATFSHKEEMLRYIDLQLQRIDETMLNSSYQRANI